MLDMLAQKTAETTLQDSEIERLRLGLETGQPHRLGLETGQPYRVRMI